MVSFEAKDERERAKRLMAMGQMAASLAHEIRNPLGSMELYCTLLKKDLAALPDSFQLAEQIHSGIRRLDRIITNCLQFSRDLSPRRNAVADTKGALEESINIIRPRAAEAGIRIHFEEMGDNDVFVDPHLVNQALLNLLLNAAEALETASETERVITIISDRSRAAAWSLSVEDNGPGIPAEHRERIFDPFVTTKKDGTGLGLAIVHSIVIAHGGSVFVNEGRRGLRVTLEFPTANND